MRWFSIGTLQLKFSSSMSSKQTNSCIYIIYIILYIVQYSAEPLNESGCVTASHSIRFCFGFYFGQIFCRCGASESWMVDVRLKPRGVGTASDRRRGQNGGREGVLQTWSHFKSSLSPSFILALRPSFCHRLAPPLLSVSIPVAALALVCFPLHLPRLSSSSFQSLVLSVSPSSSTRLSCFLSPVLYPPSLP